MLRIRIFALSLVATLALSGCKLSLNRDLANSLGTSAPSTSSSTSTSTTTTTTLPPPVAVLSGTPDDPSQTSALSVTVSGTNVTNYRYALGASSLDCTNAGNYSSSLAVATTITDPLSTTGSLKLCVVAQNTQGTWQDFGSATTHTWTRLGPISLTVTAAYPTNGANWNSYVKNDGTTLTSALDTACAGTELGYNLCLHGGEMRRVIVTGVPSCSGLTLTDSLGVFTWSCETRSGVANFFSTGFQSGKGLKDLVNASSWKNNSVTLSGTFTGSSTATTWWTNPVVPLPDNGLATDAMITLDGTNDGGNDGVFTAGTIFTLASSRASSGYLLSLDRMGLVTLSGVTLSYSGNATATCGGGGDYCLLLVYNRFAWIEGSFDGISSGGGTNSNYGLYSSGSYFGRIPSSTFSNFSNIGVRLLNSHSFRINDFTGTSNGGNGSLYFDGGTSNTLVERATLTSTGNGIICGVCHSNLFQDIVVRGGSANSIVIGGNSNIIRRFHSVSSSGNGIHLEGIGNQAYDFVIGNPTYHGVQLAGTSSGNRISRFTITGAGIGSGVSAGIRVVGASVVGNTFSEFIIQGSRQGILVDAALENRFIQANLVNNGTHGILIQNGANRNTFNQIVTANNVASGIQFDGTASTGNTFSQISTLHNGADGVALANLSNTSRFSGLLQVGNNAGKACSASGGTDAGLSDTTCTTAGTDGSSTYTSGFLSNAVLRSSRSAAASFVGKVSSDDSSNSSDSLGAATFPASPTTFDWTNFSSFFRVWGRDGSAFPAADHRSWWTSGNGQIWDWRLLATDTTLRERSGDGASANEAFVASATCPSAVDGNVVTTDQQTSAQTYLMNAAEIVDPTHPQYGASGDRDGLCESGESCIYLPNFGAYQGHGTLSPCTFNDAGGTSSITGVQMYGYSTNGI